MTVILYKYNSSYRTDHQKSNKNETMKKWQSSMINPAGVIPNGKKSERKKNRILALEWLNSWKKKQKNWTFLPKKNYITPAGWPQMGKNHQFCFFDFRHQNGSIREKKAKKYFKLFEPKKFCHPCWGDLQWAKITKIFFCIFGIRMTQFVKKSKKNILTQNLVLECVECGPKRGQNDLLGRRVIHRLNCLAMSYLNMNFQPKPLRRFQENAEKPNFQA